MQVFVPLEDALPDRHAGTLVPYRCGLACAHELRGGLVLVDGSWCDVPAINDGSAVHRPDERPASSHGPR
jgi:hypothetical protein